MSWLLENWFGSKESLEQVREEIQEHLHKERYLGVSGIENPEQSSTRVASKELFLTLYGPWGNKLEDVEEELIQYIHDELPAVVRDEVGVMPFFTNPTAEGFLVLTFIRNATKRDVVIKKLPLALVTAEGEVVARKTFDLVNIGAIADMSSRPCEFLFRWDEFIKVPEQEIPLSIVIESSGKNKPVLPEAYKVSEGLTPDEISKYKDMIDDQLEVLPGKVDIQPLDIASAEEGGLKVVVLFRNGLDKNLQFTEVPIIIRDKNQEEVARIQYGLKNMNVGANSSKLWGFYVPASSLKKEKVNPAECTAFIPDPKPATAKKPTIGNGPKGLVQ